MNPYNVRLARLDLASDNQAIPRTLGHLGSAVTGSRGFLDELVDAQLPDEAIEVFADDEGALVEALAGCAFAVAQTHITAVVTFSASLLQYVQDETGTPLLPVDATRPALTAFESVSVAATVTRIQAIDACANYFKHADQWNADWARADKRAQRTIQTMLAIGCGPGKGDNLRHGLDVLGISDHAQMQHLWYEVRDWARALRTRFAEACACKGLA